MESHHLLQITVVLAGGEPGPAPAQTQYQTQLPWVGVCYWRNAAGVSLSSACVAAAATGQWLTAHLRQQKHTLVVSSFFKQHFG